MRPSSASESKKPRALASVVAFIAYVASVVVYVVPLTAAKWLRLAIAMAEAMGAGAVPVVADVGELSDLVKDDVNGFLVRPNDIGMFTQRVVALLRDRGLWARCSEAARATALRSCSVPVVAQQWSRCLRDVVDRHPAVIADERSCHCD